jgi:hypothetical protein
MKNTYPLMGATLKSKTHLQNTFFDFLSRFLRVWLQSLIKVLIWPKKNFFWKNPKSCQKTQNVTLISNPLKKLLKNAPTKKLWAKQVWRTWVKVEKSAYFRHIFANNFFWVHFFRSFSTDSKSAWNSAYLVPILNFWKTFFLLLLALF